MELLEALRTRRAICRFKKEPVPGELIEKLLEAARCSPSSINSQPWELIVVTNPDTKANISRSFVIGPFLRETPLAIVVAINRLKSPLPVQDGSLAAYSIWLAAHDLEMGACWVNPTIPFGIKLTLGIPFNLKLVSVLAIGYSDETPMHSTKKLEDFVFLKNTVIKKVKLRFQSDS